MNTTQNVYIHASALSPAGSSPVLREGSSVSVHIIAQTGPQSYTASFAGGRFTVTSRIPLSPGQTFAARVSTAGGRVELAVLDDGVLSSSLPPVQVFDVRAAPDGMIADPQLSAYFTSLGLVPDMITAGLFSEMKQLGMKFDASLFNRARRIAAEFPGKEKEAAEAALALLQKGLPAGEHEVAALIGADAAGAGDGGGKRHAGGEADDGRTPELSPGMQSDSLVDGIADEVRSFFGALLGGKVLQGASQAGTLALFNHRGFSHGKDENGTWIQLPFEMSIDGGKETGNGILRCFTAENTEKNGFFSVKIDFSLKSFYFALYYKTEGCRRIRYSVLPCGSPRETAEQKIRLQTLLQKAFHGECRVEAEWAEPDTISAFCTDFGTIPVVRGSV
jgi:hypothetical protein